MTPSWAPHSSSNPISTTCPNPAPDFPPFSVAQLLSTGTLLLSSSGTEFTAPVALGTPAEVARARKDAMAKIGLGFMDGEDLVDDLEKELAPSDSHDDVDGPEDAHMASPPGTAPSSSPGTGNMSPHPSSPSNIVKLEPSTEPIKITSARLKLDTTRLKREDSIVPETPLDSPVGDDLSGLSARERNRLKRKRKPGNSAFVTPAAAAKTPGTPSAPPSK